MRQLRPSPCSVQSRLPAGTPAHTRAHSGSAHAHRLPRRWTPRPPTCNSFRSPRRIMSAAHGTRPAAARAPCTSSPMCSTPTTLGAKGHGGVRVAGRSRDRSNAQADMRRNLYAREGRP